MKKNDNENYDLVSTIETNVFKSRITSETKYIKTNKITSQSVNVDNAIDISSDTNSKNESLKN